LFGSKHIIDVLLGEETPQTIKHNHQALSTWGIGAEHGRKAWESFLRQVVAAGFLFVDVENHGGLKITPEGMQFLKDKPPLQLRLPRDRVMARAERAARAAGTRGAIDVLEKESDKALFARLKALRLAMARENNLPPYVIFHDKTLLALALHKPQDRAAFAQIPGVGQSKLDKYAPAFMAVIQDTLADAA
jgi:ATP-dependent DNA helicase RecQ